MDKKSQALVLIFLLIVAASVVSTYRRYIIFQDISYELDETAFQEALLEE
ncbi:MAG: hypothetical protein Q7R67_01235 [bacterium]|nr:hypothetical protein [bacterium]